MAEPFLAAIDDAGWCSRIGVAAAAAGVGVLLHTVALMREPLTKGLRGE